MITENTIKNYFLQDQIVENQIQFKINQYKKKSIQYQTELQNRKKKSKKSTITP